MKEKNKKLNTYIILWITQALSSFGSAMTGFALIIWSYEQQGSALVTALLAICSYAPYVMFSIFAGALSDRWNKKYTMLVCDSVAAICTGVVFLLLGTHQLQIWHLYLLNGINGLMNTFQQPASDIATSLLIEEEHYQKASGMRSFSNSLSTVLTPVVATMILSFAGMKYVILMDLLSFGIAFITLAFFIELPEISNARKQQEEGIWLSAKEGLKFLKENQGIMELILFLAAINFTASMYNAALPAMLLSRNGGSQAALGAVNTCIGIANIAGSLIATVMKKPKSRVAIICNTLLFSMGTENFILAFSNTVPLWCLAGIMGWILIPIMGANMDVLLRSNIPISMQGRVFSARNALQFFTIPLGYFMGGFFVDYVFEPMMAAQQEGSFLSILFGQGKGSGAAFLFFFMGLIGVATCLIFRRCKAMWLLE